MSEVFEAVNALDDRKEAIAGEADVEPEQLPLLAVGLGVDPQEIAHVAGMIGPHFALRLDEGEPERLFATCWSDGLLTGLLLAELKRSDSA